MADTTHIDISKNAEPIGEISVNSIFAAMHKKAAEEAQKASKNYKVVNSAVNDKGNFEGAGQQIIMATPTSEEINKDEALNAIKTYVQWFSGPDVANKITIDNLIPVTQPLSEEDKKAAGKKQEDDKETKREKQHESLIINSALRKLFESTFEEDQEIAKENGEKVTAYYIQYEAEIGNMKESTVDSAWQRIKKQTGDFLKGITFTIRNSLTGGGEKTLGSIGDIVDRNKIDPKKLESNVEKELKTDYPGMTPTIKVLDTKSIINKLSKRLQGASKSLLKNVKYALCIKVNKDDDNYELISKQDIADYVTKATSVDNKKPKAKISKKDVILVNNYEQKKDKNDNQFKKQEISKESYERVFNLTSLLFEDYNEQDIDVIFEKQVSPDVKEQINKLTDLFSQHKSLKTALKNSKKNLTGGGKYLSTVKGKHKKGDPISDEWVKSHLNTAEKLKSLPLETLKLLVDEATKISENISIIEDIKKLIQDIASRDKTKHDSKLDSFKKLKSLLEKHKVYDSDFDTILDNLLSIDRNSLIDIRDAFSNYKDQYEEKHKDTVGPKQKQLIDQIKKLLKKTDKVKAVEDETHDKEVRKLAKSIVNNKIDEQTIAKITDEKQLDKKLEVCKKLEAELEQKKENSSEVSRVKKTALKAKFHYIKYALPELEKRGYYKPKYPLTFDIPTNQNTIEEIEKLPWNSKLAELQKVIKLSDKEIDQFKDKSNKELKEMLEQTNKQTNGSAAQKAILKLHEEFVQLVKDPATGEIRDLKSFESIPVGNKPDSIDEIRDNSSNWWDQTSGAIIRHIDNIKKWIETNKDNVDKEITSKKTQYDFYIIPMQNISMEADKESLKPNSKESNN